MVKPNKRKIASKTSDNEQIQSPNYGLIEQENTWKNYSTIYDEIREDCRLACIIHERIENKPESFI